MRFNLLNIGINKSVKFFSDFEIFTEILKVSLSATRNSITFTVLTSLHIFLVKYKINVFLSFFEKVLSIHCCNLVVQCSKIQKIAGFPSSQSLKRISSSQKLFNHVKESPRRKKIQSSPSRRSLDDMINPIRIQKALKKYGTWLKIKRAIKLFSYLNKGAEGKERRMDPFYHPEALDPWHRYGTVLHRFFTIWKETTTKDRFLIWMKKIERGFQVEGTENLLKEELINTNKEIIKIPVVQYFTDEELKQYEVSVVNGKIYTPKHGFVDTTQSKYRFIFVVTLANKIYLGTKEKDKDIYWNHSSFSNGKPVKLAGILTAEGGDVKTIRDESGHYVPSEKMMYEGLKIFEQKGIKIASTSLEFGGYDSKDKYYVKKFYDTTNAFFTTYAKSSYP